jgi:GAF domain-containing protein
MPSEVSTADANRDLARRVAELERELAEARDQRKATGDILRSISSAADLQSVLNALAESAARFCSADDVVIYRLESAGLPILTHYGSIPAPAPMSGPPIAGTATGRSILEQRTVHVADLQAETEAFPEGSSYARDLGFRTMVSVPLLREDVALGAIVLRRTEVAPFTEKQIELVTTFADQAVIAIENARLFEEVQARTSDLQEALEYQTAISDVLGVISRSPSELFPVLDAIATTACKLCQADHASVFRVHNGFCQLEASQADPALIQYLRDNPLPVDANLVTARAVRERRAVHNDPSIDIAFGSLFVLHKSRSLLAVPLLREGIAIGVITIGR